MREKQTRVVIVSGVMLLFGGIYAIYVALRPFKPRFTWLSVAIGDGITDIGSLGVIYILTGSIRLALVPLLMHFLTGGPMITGQILKHSLQRSGQILIEDDASEYAEGYGDPA